MAPTDPLVTAVAAVAESFQRWITSSAEARALASALAQWLEQASRKDAAGSAASAAAGGAVAGGSGAGESPAVAGAEGSRAGGASVQQLVEVQPLPPAPAIALAPKRIIGPRVVAPAEPVMDAADAARALIAGLGTGEISPRHVPAGAGPAPAPGSAIEVAWDVIAKRCRLKAEACAFARERNALGFDALKEEYDRLRAEANTVQPCYLWGIQRDTEWMEAAQLETAEGCFTNLSAAAELAAIAPDDVGVLELLSEAQGGVFLLLQGIEQARGDDREQRTVYAWLRGRVDREEVAVSVLDAARGVDPMEWRGLAARLAGARERLEFSKRSERARRQALKTLEYHAGRIAAAGEADEGADLSHDWNKVQDAAAAFLESGGQPSDPALFGTLAPLGDRVPESMLGAEALSRIMPYLDERLSEQEEGEAENAAPTRRPSDELLRAREMLRGRVVVLIGGKCRHQSKRLIEREFELKELRWLSSEPHTSIAPFEAEIARPEVAAVLMMIRWSSHSFEGAKEFCVRHGKPWVRVPAGYNPSQLAHQIMQQQGERLAVV